MSDDKSKVGDKAGEIARNIWLAGVGAYGRAVDEAQGRLEKAGVETPKLFRDLVKAGAALEDEARSALSASHETRQSVEERISRVRENFRLQRAGRGDDLQALHAKIDRLTESVDTLSAALASLAAVTGTAGKTSPARKKAAMKNKRAPAKSKRAPAKNKKAPAKKKAAAKKKAPAGKRAAAPGKSPAAARKKTPAKKATAKRKPRS